MSNNSGNYLVPYQEENKQDKRKVRCRHCGSRAYDNLVVCPSCGRELHGSSARITSLLWPLILVALFGTILLTRMQGPSLWFGQQTERGRDFLGRVATQIEPRVMVETTPIGEEAAVTEIPVTSGDGVQEDASSQVALAPTATPAGETVLVDTQAVPTETPTATQIPTNTDVPAATSLPTSTIAPTEVPPTNTLAPTDTPVSTATSRPTNTAPPTDTSVPTNTALPTTTTAPTETATTTSAPTQVDNESTSGGEAETGNTATGRLTVSDVLGQAEASSSADDGESSRRTSPTAPDRNVTSSATLSDAGSDNEDTEDVDNGVASASQVTDTPEPTDTLSPTDTTTAVPTNTRNAVDAATSTATATRTTRPTNTPRATSTPEDTDTPEPTNTPTAIPTETTEPTDTPTPTNTPTPEPTNTPTATATVAPQTYQIQSGDTLLAIAAQTDTTVQEIMTLNQLTDEDVRRLRPGQLLLIPGDGTAAPSVAAQTESTAAPQSEPIEYQVQAGDTILAIAQRFGISANRLAFENGLNAEQAALIRIGQVLLIPAAESSNGSPAPSVSQDAAQNTTEQASAVASQSSTAYRLDAPQLRSPEDGTPMSCSRDDSLAWTAVPFMAPSDQYVLNMGFVNGYQDNGEPMITWVIEPKRERERTSWELERVYCSLAPQEFGRTWYWYVQVADENGTLVSPPSELRSFTWR